MRILVGDLESDGLLGTATKVHCCVLKDINSGQIWKFHEGSHTDYVKTMLKALDSADVLIFHNGIGFDFPLLRKLYGWEPKAKVVDTLIMSRLQNPNRRLPYACPNKRTGPHSVEAWGYRLGRGKPDHNDWSVFSTEMLHRCTEDVEIQHLIHNALIEEGKGQGWRNAHMMSFKLFDILQRQEEYGWLMDVPYANKTLSLLEHWIRSVDKALVPHLPNIREVKETKIKGEYGWVKKPFLKSGKYSASVLNWLGNDEDNTVCGPFSRVEFRPVNLNSNAETKAYLLRLGWNPLKWNYDDEGNKRSPKMDKDDPFDGITGGIGRLIAKRVQCRHRHSQITGWLERLRDDGRLPQIISGIAATGRLTHKNIVNVPGGKSFMGQQMRKMFIAKEGFKIVGTDSAACQIRMLVARMGDPAYEKVVLEGDEFDEHDRYMGTDIHTVNGIAGGLIRARDVEACKGHDKESMPPSYQDVKGGRAKAKNFFYAFLFGGGDEKVGSLVGGGAAEGKKLKSEFLEGLPALGNLVRGLTAEWRSNARVRTGRWGKPEYYDGWVVGLDGRPIRIASEHQILVYMLQSDEAIMMQTALCFLYKWMMQLGWKWDEHFGFVANVHDEYQCEVRDDLAEQYAELASRSITVAAQFLKINCRHDGNSDIGINWHETH